VQRSLEVDNIRCCCMDKQGHRSNGMGYNAKMSRVTNSRNTRERSGGALYQSAQQSYISCLFNCEITFTIKFFPQRDKLYNMTCGSLVYMFLK